MASTASMPQLNTRTQKVAPSLILAVDSWAIILIGMGRKSAMIHMPLAKFEVFQPGYGLYVKYLRAGFLAVFASTMAIQFVSYFLAAGADYRDEPVKRQLESLPTH